MLNRGELLAVLGPFGSNSAWRFWDILVWPDGLVAWPYSVWESWQVALSWPVPFVSNPDRQLLSYDPTAFRQALSGRSLRVHARHDIASITVRFNGARNQILIVRRDGTRERYSIFLRRATPEYVAALKSAFPDLYREEGAPTTLLSRVLKRLHVDGEGRGHTLRRDGVRKGHRRLAGRGCVRTKADRWAWSKVRAAIHQHIGPYVCWSGCADT